jgi:hypothetical protein
MPELLLCCLLAAGSCPRVTALELGLDAAGARLELDLRNELGEDTGADARGRP